MPSITFVNQDGSRRTVDAKPGETLMQAARANDIDAILAECGGAMACATCHVIVDPAWFERVGEAPEAENDMLEFAASPPEPTSRLSCQVMVTDEMNGLVVRMPERQS